MTDKHYKKLCNNLMKTGNIDDFWQAAQELLVDQSPAWYNIKGIEKIGAEKWLKNMISMLKDKDKAEAMSVPDEEINEMERLSGLLENALADGRYTDVVSVFLVLVMRHISDGSALPDNFTEADLYQSLAPCLSETMIIPFFIMSSLSSQTLKANTFNNEQRERFFALLAGLFMEMEQLIHIESLIRQTNPRRDKQIAEFVDTNHEVMEKYYDLQESSLRPGQMKKQLQKLIDKDPKFFDPYQQLADIYFNESDHQTGSLLLDEAFDKAMQRIVDREGRWPQTMEWGWLENRHLIRILDRFAYQLWDQGRDEYALEIYRRLLKSNPRDNIGARYNILAVNLGYYPDEVEDMFQSSTQGFADAIKMDDWFNENAVDFPEEFDGWFKDMEQMP